MRRRWIQLFQGFVPAVPRSTLLLPGSPRWEGDRFPPGPSPLPPGSRRQRASLSSRDRTSLSAWGNRKNLPLHALLCRRLFTASAILSLTGSCVSRPAGVRPAALAALLQDSSQGRFRVAALGRLTGRVASLLRETDLAGFQVHGRVLLPVSQLGRQTEGRKLHGAFLELHRWRGS